MKLFTTFSFLSSFAGKKAEQAGNSLTGLIVRFDPETASEAQIAEFEKQLNVLTDQVAKLRDEYKREQDEADRINGRYHQLLSAADVLQKQAEAEADAGKKQGLEASLAKLLGEIEHLVPDVDRETNEAKQAADFLHEYEAAAEEAATKLASAREKLNRAQHDMQAAQLHKERAAEHAEQAAVIAGIRSHADSFGVALGAMEDAAHKDEQAAAAANYKAQLLTGAAHKNVEEDANIKAALEASGGAAKPAESLSERLAALKNRSAATV